MRDRTGSRSQGMVKRCLSPVDSMKAAIVVFSRIQIDGVAMQRRKKTT
jgi:hypothetical protein